MSVTFFDILKIIGSLAFFIYGMKVMSEGIQRAAGSEMRNILRTMTSNRYIGVLSGILLTALIQSSSATTVMTVSIVNAGLLSLIESAGLIMGANVGTTITGWLIAMGIANFSIVDYSLPLVAVGLLMLFSQRGRLRFWGEAIIGLALLFMGLGFLKDAVPDLNQNSELLQFLSNYTNLGFLSTLLFVVVGIVITIILQSSSAAMALTLVMCTKGWISYPIAAAMILGMNIGTTLTAEIAALVANVHAKRSARIHTMFNIFGVLWMIVLLPFFLNWIDTFILQKILNTSAYSSASAIPLGLAAFHTTFNVLNVLLLINFVPLLIKIARSTVRVRNEEDENFQLGYFYSMSKTPELSILEVQKGTAKYGEITSRMSGFTNRLMLSTDKKEQRQLLERIAKYEEITDRIEIEVTEYLTKVSREEISSRLSIRLRSILTICSELERIGDVYYQMSKTLDRKIEDKIWFNQNQREQLQSMFDLVDKGLQIMVTNLSNSQYDTVSKTQAKTIEQELNALYEKLSKDSAATINAKGYNINSALIFSSLTAALEKIGNHIINITEAIAGEI